MDKANHESSTAPCIEHTTGLPPSLHHTGVADRKSKTGNVHVTEDETDP